ncbi:DUF234 domain-containing protein [Sulfurimonas sp. SAG-AH-194-L11]|nr:DUF234 domain-containing protein [Sulfurimonas sp. SAG-AH-194-L11]MDF1877213.1 DUF234 domain-containing protein [Sulfurimonas sp. SAG-AH-194-L11]
MTNSKLLEQFRSFYFRNYPDDMEIQISYFSIFGGLGWDIDTSKPINELIQELIVENFDILNEKINVLIDTEPTHKRLLQALAVGDRRIFSAFKRAGLNNGNGGGALNYLQDVGLIQMEYSRERHPREANPSAKLKRRDARHRVSHKVLFSHPFVRFWFYFIAPQIKNIKNKDYEPLHANIAAHLNSYTSLIFEELSEVLLNYNLRDAQIISSGSYWDAHLEIDILTLTDDNKIYVSECKWTNHIINKKELHKLREKCVKLDILPSQIILFSKRGFSKELQQLKGSSLALYSCEDFEALVKSSSKDELIENFI